MNDYKWIKSKGKCNSGELEDLLSKCIADYKYIMMLSVDSFSLVSAEQYKSIDTDKLLETRVFNENEELYAYRGSAGEEFQWRIAISEGLEDKKDYIIREHYLDINEEKSAETMEDGSRDLITTVGGKYSLPVSSEMKKIRIMEYITYSENGMARIADAKICGFVG